MSAHSSLERCMAFVNLQAGPASKLRLPGNGKPGWRAITISRQAGAGGHAVGEKLAELLRAGDPTDSRPWMVFDRNLVQRVLEDHHLPGYIAGFMPEDRGTQIEQILDELFRQRPPAIMLVHKTAETILRLIELGHVVVIGRGANIVTQKFQDVLHVRLVASLERRVEYLQKIRECSRNEALEFVHNEDRGRRRYLKEYFDKEIEDPLLYHMVLNTELLGFDATAELIARFVLNRVHHPVA
jgi:cytidylate kinase